MRREEVRRFVWVTTSTVLSGLLIAVIVFVVVMTAAGPAEAVATIPLLLSLSALAGVVGTLAGGWRLIAGENDFAGRDRTTVRRVRDTVLRGGDHRLDARESRIAAIFAHAFPFVACARAVFTGLLLLQVTVAPLGSWLGRPDGWIPATFMALAALGFCAYVGHTIMRVRRARRYAAGHPLPSPPA